ncbi:MAG: rhomboid family intramembrane serine protease [Winogradskyella sp.]|nr:rhomboid family intramembrane serine protease [Winogradskyella sp.]MBT8376150.1 rhomboid family intramembrane serine protease [Bacteroidia bacterium]NNC46246.1 rhomboid family intramembrane serine protease [Winogradskyella sp.]NNF85997.1 rhomboid family intramembrane serine protease [Winogradskyella sp.]NNL81973.1 rhomboid family intramembrane serine protease [Winogradskyella sp.]
MTSFQELKYKFNNFNSFEKIITLNVILFIVGKLIAILGKGTDGFYYLKLPADFMDFIVMPWSIITYGFVHYDFFHLVFNLLILYYMSRMLLNLFRPKMALNIYMLGIIVGGLCFLLAYNLLPTSILRSTAGLVGASAGVRALIIFLGVYMADTEVRLIFFNVKLKYIALVLVSLDLIGLFGTNAGGNIAHLGGALLGYLYATRLREGQDIGMGFERFMDAIASWFKPKSKLKTVHRQKRGTSTNGAKTKDFKAYNKQKQIDIILDKISKSGYDSLTAEEKKFLFDAGKE